MRELGAPSVRLQMTPRWGHLTCYRSGLRVEHWRYAQDCAPRSSLSKGSFFLVALGCPCQQTSTRRGISAPGPLLLTPQCSQNCLLHFFFSHACMFLLKYAFTAASGLQPAAALDPPHKGLCCQHLTWALISEVETYLKALLWVQEQWFCQALWWRVQQDGCIPQSGPGRTPHSRAVGGITTSHLINDHSVPLCPLLESSPFVFCNNTVLL